MSQAHIRQLDAKPEPVASPPPARNTLPPTVALLTGALVFVVSTFACARGGGDLAAAKRTVDSLTRKPVSNNPEIKKAVDAAIEQTLYTFDYDASYAKLDYPNGDVPRDRGVCADVIVRAFRNAGVDLQKELHEDMSRHFDAYPAKWGASKPDPNIDHRRVLNLMTFFERQGKSVPITKAPTDYVPGDVVAWQLETQHLHIGIVTDARPDGMRNYLIVHNIGAGARIEDVLLSWKIVGHYRMWK